jgi:hypothetical protein
MGLPSLDNISGTIDSATASVSDTISNGLSDLANFSPASALSSVGDLVSGVVSGIGSFFKPLSGVTLPLKNPLFDYASYDYVIGLAVLTSDQFNNPDKSYMKGGKLNYILKDANADPSNRIKTPFGQFDYIIDNLEITSTIGLEKNKTTNVFKMSFDIIEPYSMGTFIMSLQQAAWNVNQDNYTKAPYLLTIDFRGSKENGTMANIPNTSRKIPFHFQNITMTVDERGAVYRCEGMPCNAPALSQQHGTVKTDASVKGTTVQEVLQTGEKSLQVVLNKRLQQLKTEKVVNIPDQIVILFPKDVSSAGSSKSGATEDSTGATASTKSNSLDAITQQLGLVKSTIPANNTYVQDPANVNDIGKAKMGYGETRKGDAPVGKDQKVIVGGDVIRSNNGVNPTISDIKFSQDTDIPTAIEAVILNSDYVTTQLKQGNIDSKGQRQWFRVDTQLYQQGSGNVDTATGDIPKVIVYRIVPYTVHTSSGQVEANKKPPGFAELEKQCVKVYDYVYTGKNVDVLKFHIEFKTGFVAKMAATSTKKTQDNKSQAQTSGAEGTDKANVIPVGDGKAPEKKLGVTPTSVNYGGTQTSSDNKGGGGIETEGTRVARQFHEAITSASGMMQLDLQIIGDPYWIAQSGTGNYTSSPTQYQNLNHDTTVNYQNGEVDIKVNFRSPVDINQTTGLYDFGKSTKSAPVLAWSGIYRVLQVVSRFSGGQFTQSLSGPRRNGYELSGSGDGSATINVSNEKKDPAPTSGSAAVE